jgi:hypothetical protein
MKFDGNANHAMWTRETNETFSNFITRAKEEGCYVDDHGRVDIGAVMHLLVNSYAEGRYTILRDPVKVSSQAVEAVAEKIIEAKEEKPKRQKKEKAVEVVTENPEEAH